MYKVLVGAISPEGEHLLRTYLDKFFPDCQIEPLKAIGIKGKMKNQAVRQDVLMVILDDMLYDACVGVVDAVLALDKVHHYQSDDGLRDYLTNKFGPLEDFGETGTIPPDMLIGQEAPEDEFIPKVADLSKTSSTEATAPPDSLSKAETVDEELPTTEESTEVSASDTPSEVVEKLNSHINELQSQLLSKDTLIRSLTMQLDDKKSSDEDDIAAMARRIRELEKEVEEKDAQLSQSDQGNFVALGKVARAEQVLGEFDELRRQIAQASEDCENLTNEREELTEKLKKAEDEAAELREQVAKIPELQKLVDERTKRVSVLEQELEVKSSTITDLENSVSEHEGVVSELEQLKSELGVLQQQIDSDKEKLVALDEAKEELSKKQLEIDNLQADIRALNDKLSAQASDIEQLREDVARKSSELEESQRSLEECREELKSKEVELEECSQARDEAVSRASASAEQLQTSNESTQELTTKVEELTSQTEEQSRKLEDALSQLSDKSKECDTLNAQLETVTADLDAKTTECEGLAAKLAKAGSELAAKAEEFDGLERKLGEVQESSSTGLQEIEDKLKKKDAELTKVRGSLSDKDATIAKLTAEISELQEQLASKNSEVTKIREQVNDIRKQLLDAQSAGSEAAISADTQKQAFDRLLAEKASLEDKLVVSESKCMELESRIKSLEEELQQERTHRGSVDDSNAELIAQNEKFTNIISQLEENLVKAKADDDMLKRLESDLLEERRKSARLQSEVEVMKKTRDTDKASDLRIEIVRLQNELKDIKESTVDAAEAEATQTALTQSREYAAKLELDLVAKDNQLAELSSGLFGQLRNIAIPKSIYDFRANAVEGLSDKFIVVASGSEESTASVYQTLKQACAASNKKTLIVDLVTDSSIDRDFGIKKVSTPIEWLTGEKPFREFLSDTRFGHVKVLSTALAYINDLFLMTVDWDRCLKELESFSAQTIVLYVGCLNNLVTKVLFDKFIKSMKGYVIVKATPINIRTTILNLAGFKKPFPPTVTVECTNFSDTSSASMYQRLVASNYTTHILRDNEALKL